MERIIGMDALIRDFKLLGRVPQTAANKGSLAGGRIVLRAAKANAPEDTGELKKALILKKERKRKPGKTVHDVMIDPGKNDIFVKTSAEGERSYYPASQEYGFMTKDGQYIPGYRYLRKALEDNKSEFERVVVEAAGKEVDKVLRKKGLR